MMNISGFTSESLEKVNSLLYAENNKNRLLGQCGQKQLREQMKGDRTPAEQAGDQKRGQALQGRNTMNSATRSEAAKKAAAKTGKTVAKKTWKGMEKKK
jgi:hypothetical protein